MAVVVALAWHWRGIGVALAWHWRGIGVRGGPHTHSSRTPRAGCMHAHRAARAAAMLCLSICHPCDLVVHGVSPHRVAPPMLTHARTRLRTLACCKARATRVRCSVGAWVCTCLTLAVARSAMKTHACTHLGRGEVGHEGIVEGVFGVVLAHAVRLPGVRGLAEDGSGLGSGYGERVNLSLPRVRDRGLPDSLTR